MPLQAEPRLHFANKTFVDTHDIGEAREIFRRIYHEITIERQAGARGFRWRASRASLGSISVAHASVLHGCKVTSAQDGTRYIFTFLQRGGGRFDHGGKSGPVGPGTAAMMFSPDREAHFDVAPGTLQRTLSIERATLEAHLHKLTGTELRHPLHFHPRLDVGRGSGARLEHVLDHVIAELEHPDGLTAAPLFARSLTDLLLTAVLELAPHDHARVAAPATPRVMPAYLRHAEEYMDAHSSEPIVLSDVAATVGVSLRSLQATFRHFRAFSPGEFLRERRLATARAHLLAGAPGTTVAAAALAAGYRHMSHFSVEYKRRFGESPRETLLLHRRPPR